MAISSSTGAVQLIDFKVLFKNSKNNSKRRLTFVRRTIQFVLCAAPISAEGMPDRGGFGLHRPRNRYTFAPEKTMFTSQDQIRDFHKAQLNTLNAYGKAIFQAGEKLAELHVGASRDMLAQSSEMASTLLSAKDPQELMRLATSAAQPQTDKLAQFSRSAYEIASNATTEIGRVFETQLSEGSRHAADFVEQIAKAAPSGSEHAVSFLKNAVTVANDTVDTLTKAARQASAAAESNIAAAVAVASDAVKTKGKKFA